MKLALASQRFLSNDRNPLPYISGIFSDKDWPFLNCLSRKHVQQTLLGSQHLNLVHNAIATKMPLGAEEIRKRRDVGLKEVIPRWIKGMGMGRKDVRQILQAHAKSLGIPDFYDELTDDDRTDIAILAAEAARNEPFESLTARVDPGEALTAASLRKVDTLRSSAHNGFGGGGDRRPYIEASKDGEKPRKVPSYGDSYESVSI